MVGGRWSDGAYQDVRSPVLIDRAGTPPPPHRTALLASVRYSRAHNLSSKTKTEPWKIHKHIVC